MNEMAHENDDDDGADTQQIVTVVNAFLKAMESDTVQVKLRSGGTVSGSIAGLNIRKREKKGEVTWNAKLNIATEAGDLQIDCHNVVSIT
jgi:hypothetical protein